MRSRQLATCGVNRGVNEGKRSRGLGWTPGACGRGNTHSRGDDLLMRHGHRSGAGMSCRVTVVSAGAAAAADARRRCRRTPRAVRSAFPHCGRAARAPAAALPPARRAPACSPAPRRPPYTSVPMVVCLLSTRLQVSSRCSPNPHPSSRSKFQGRPLRQRDPQRPTMTWDAGCCGSAPRLRQTQGYRRRCARARGPPRWRRRRAGRGRGRCCRVRRVRCDAPGHTAASRAGGRLSLTVS